MKVLDELQELSLKKCVEPSDIGIIYLGLGEKNLALASLEKGYEFREDSMPLLKVSPHYDGLRSDPRFTDLLRRMGLTP